MQTTAWQHVWSPNLLSQACLPFSGSLPSQRISSDYRAAIGTTGSSRGYGRRPIDGASEGLNGQSRSCAWLRGSSQVLLLRRGTVITGIPPNHKQSPRRVSERKDLQKPFLNTFWSKADPSLMLSRNLRGGRCSVLELPLAHMVSQWVLWGPGRGWGDRDGGREEELCQHVAFPLVLSSAGTGVALKLWKGGSFHFLILLFGK